MRKMMLPLLGVALLFTQPCFAQDYAECRGLCERDNADCMSEPQASEPEEQIAKEARCSEKLQSCYAQCDYLKPQTNDTPPEAPPEAPPQLVAHHKGKAVRGGTR